MRAVKSVEEPRFKEIEGRDGARIQMCGHMPFLHADRARRSCAHSMRAVEGPRGHSSSCTFPKLNYSLRSSTLRNTVDSCDCNPRH